MKYIRKKLNDSKADLFGYFYLLYRLHKTPIKTRPVCSDYASLPHTLGEWVDEMLQALAKTQHTYFQDLFTLKWELDRLTLSTNTSLFTYNDVYIYTYIDTEDCIPRLSDFLLARDQTTKFRHYSPKAQTEAVKVVIHNNRIRFQDITVEQPRGIIMGMSPTPSLVNIYVAIHKVNELLKKCWALYFLPLPLY